MAVGNLSQKLQFLISANADEAIRVFQKTGAAAEKELGKAESKIDKVGAALTKFGAGAMAFSGVAAAGLYKMGAGAAELEAKTAALNQVLGETVANNIGEWAKNGATEVGLSERAITGAATAFGSLGKVAGYAGGELEEFTKRQVRLSADMAAFADISPELVIQDLRAAYAGSSETLQKYNVFVNDANIKQAIFAATGEEVKGVLTSKQRVMGIDLLLMEQTVDMQGQWARESSGLAGQQATLRANLQNLSDEIGRGILPVLTQITGVVGDAVGVFTGLPGPVKTTLGAVAGFGTVGIGAAGALSFVVGQTIKFRENLSNLSGHLMTSQGGLTKLGAAAGVAGMAITVLALNAAHAAREQRQLNDAVSGLDKVADDAMAAQLGGALAAAALAGESFTDVLVGIGDASPGTLQRIKELADAGKLQGNQFIESAEFTDALSEALTVSAERHTQAAIDAERSRAILRRASISGPGPEAALGGEQCAGA